MPSRKSKETVTKPKQSVTVSYRILPYFAVETNSPSLSGIRGLGDTPLKALVSMRGEIVRRLPLDQYDLVESIENPEFVAGWKMPEPF